MKSGSIALLFDSIALESWFLWVQKGTQSTTWFQGLWITHNYQWGCCPNQWSRCSAVSAQDPTSQGLLERLQPALSPYTNHQRHHFSYSERQEAVLLVEPLHMNWGYCPYALLKWIWRSIQPLAICSSEVHPWTGGQCSRLQAWNRFWVFQSASLL